ncbi:MAG: MATE family efflux transporter [Dehalococcoidales bacterium]|nr:MATE family efflux transporter [Dehalococcoidales bacterium]
MRARNEHRSLIMGQESITKLLLRFSTPAIISSLVSSSYSLIDAIFIGRLGPEALAAVSVAFPLMGLFMAVGMGTAVGAASLIARRLGEKKYEEASRAAGTAIGNFVILGTILQIFCLLNLEPILRLFGATETVLPLAKSYVRVELIFQMINFSLMALAEIIRAEGNPVLASSSMITAGVMNCIWDPILGFGLGPFPEMGMAGFALATTIGRGIGLLIIIIYLISGKSSYRFRPSYFVPRWDIVKEIYRVGISRTIQMGGGMVTHVIANVTAASYGVIPLAVQGVLFRASSFAFMPCMGLGQGILPLVSYNYAAKQKERVGEVVIKAGLLSFAWGSLCWIVVMFFATQVLSLFNTEPQFLDEGSRAFRIFASVFFFVGIQMTLTMFFQGIGRGLPSLIMASARQIIFLIPSVLILPRIFGLNGLWSAHPVADLLSVTVALVWTTVEFRQQEIPFRLRYPKIEAAPASPKVE